MCVNQVINGRHSSAGVRVRFIYGTLYVYMHSSMCGDMPRVASERASGV